MNNVIYLTPRPSGVSSVLRGKGTQSSPLDASTPAKLDQIYRAYPSNVVFVYNPGVYSTNGWQYRRQQTLGSNVAHVGHGKGISTIKLVNAKGASSSTDGAIFATDFGAEVQNVIIKDLTLDVNARVNPAFANRKGALIAIRGYGDKINVSNCEVIGFGTSSGAECFPIIVGRTRNVSKRSQLGANVIEDCVFHSPVRGNRGPLTCILMGTQGMGSRLGFDASLDVVRGCQFYNISKARTGFTVCHGITAPIIEDCLFDGIDDPCYWEAQGRPIQPVDVDYANLIVKGCTFRDYKSAISLRQAGPKTATTLLNVTGNTFLSRAARRNRQVSAIRMVSGIKGSPQTALRTLRVENNSMSHIDGTYQTGASGTHFMYVSSEFGGDQLARNVIIRNNMVDLRNHRHLTLNELPSPANSVGTETVTGNIAANGMTMDANLTTLGL